MSFPTFAGTIAAAGLLLLGAVNTQAAPTMSIDSTVGAPGSTNLVAINIMVDTNVTQFQFDLFYSTNYLTPGAPVRGDALADHLLLTNEVSPGQFRVVGFTVSSSALSSGVLAYIPFIFNSNAPDHDEPLTLSNVVLTDTNAFFVPVSVNSNATLSITVPPRFTAILPTNSGAIHLELAGTVGRTYVILAATNLTMPQWTPLITNTNLTGVLPFDDVSAGNDSVRFYRAAFDH